MKYKSPQIWTVILSTIILCLTLSGCTSQPDQSGNKQEQEQPEGTETAPATSATNAPEAAKAPATKSAASTEVKKNAEPPAPPAPPPPRKATLAEGTAITVVTASLLSTKTQKSGDAFQAMLDQDIVDGDWIIAKRGAPVSGIVSDSDPGGRVKGVASITLKLEKLTLADGQEIAIKTNAYTASANTSKKKDAAKIGIGAGIGAAIGAIAGGGKGAAIGAGVGGAAGTGAALATRGDAAEVPSELAITFKLAAPVQVTEKK